MQREMIKNSGNSPAGNCSRQSSVFIIPTSTVWRLGKCREKRRHRNGFSGRDGSFCLRVGGRGVPVPTGYFSRVGTTAGCTVHTVQRRTEVT